MKLFKLFKKGQKGITLVELMVVMAILAVLASIIFPAVSGTQEVSVDSQTKQDASTVGSAMNDFFAAQTGAEVTSTDGADLYGTTSAITTDNETISSRWPENYITSEYADVFTSSNITSIKVDGQEVTKVWVEERTAIDFVEAGAGGLLFVSAYMPAIPDSADDKSEQFNNYLWLAKKTTASGGITNASRQVEVWKLTNVNDDGTQYQLTYEQIY